MWPTVRWEVPGIMEPVEATLLQLDEALDAAGAIPVSCLGGPDSLAFVCGLQVAQNRLDAIRCRALAETGPDALTAHGETGHRSVAGVVAARTGLAPSRPRADAQLGAWLVDFPILADAFGDGVISVQHVRAIRARDNTRTRPYLPEAQQYLIDATQHCTWAEFTALMRCWEIAADPDGEEPMEQVENRRCNYTKRSDGSVTGSFTLDPLAGDTFVTAMDRYVQNLFRQDTETGSNRKATHRRADALVDLTTQGANNPNVTSPPLIHIILGEEVATDGFTRTTNNGDGCDRGDDCDGIGDDDSGRSGGTCTCGDTGPVDLTRLPVDYNDPLRRCELIDGTPLHPQFALAALASATLRRLILGADSEVLDLGRTVRTFPARLKQILMIQARGRCQQPGCDNPHAWLQADHLIPWSRGGPTNLTNGQILCDPHNKAKRDKPPPPSPSILPEPDPKPGAGPQSDQQPKPEV